MPTSRPELPPDVQRALDSGNFIVAIKLLRASTGLGLKETKDLIDAYRGDGRGGRDGRGGGGGPGSGGKQNAFEAKPSPVPPRDSRTGLAPGEVPRHSGTVWRIVLAAVFGVIAYYFLRGA